MICTSRPQKHTDRCSEPLAIPSPARIQQLTGEIQKTRSPRALARRTAQGSGGVELMLISALGFADDRPMDDE
jgi:hypothetical protein